jgi:glycosyltransferase involved in cell wall biosynthesis
MKVAFATEFSDLGGGETNLVNLVIGLADTIEVTVYCPKGKLFDRLKSCGCDVKEIKLKPRRRWYRGLPIFYKTPSLITEFKNYDLIHAYSLNILPLFFGLGHPLVWTNHGIFEKPCGLRAFIISHYVNKVVAVSKHVYDLSSFTHSKKELIHLGTLVNPLELDFRNKLSQHEVFNIVMIGRFQRIKGQDLLLKAMKIVAEQNISIKFNLLLIGDVNESDKDNYAYKEKVLSLAENIKLKNLTIEFIGFKPSVVEYIANSHIVVIPSRYESFSMVAIEGLAQGKPVIGPRIGGLLDIITNENIGRLFRPGDEKELAETILYSVKNYATFLPSACIERALDFSIDCQVSKHIILYRKLINDFD